MMRGHHASPRIRMPADPLFELLELPSGGETAVDEVGLGRIDAQDEDVVRPMLRLQFRMDIALIEVVRLEHPNDGIEQWQLVVPWHGKDRSRQASQEALRMDELGFEVRS